MKIAIIIISIFCFISCSPNVYVEKDEATNLSNYKTFDWAYDPQDAIPTLNDIQISNLTNEVYSVLQQNGYKHDSLQPDMLIKADILIERTLKERSDAVYSQPFSRTFYNRYTGRLVNVYYPSHFLGYDNTQYQVKEGTLTLTFFDARTEKMIWQGWTVTEIGSNFTSSQLKSAAQKILKKFNSN